MSGAVVTNGGNKRSPLKGYTEQEEYRELQKLVQLQELVRSGNHSIFKPKNTTTTATTTKPTNGTIVQNVSKSKESQPPKLENNLKAESQETKASNAQVISTKSSVNSSNAPTPISQTKNVSEINGQGGAIKAIDTLSKKNTQNIQKSSSVPKAEVASTHVSQPVDSIFSQYPSLKSKIIDKETLDKQHARSKINQQRSVLHEKIRHQYDDITLSRSKKLEPYLESSVDFDDIFRRAIDLANTAYEITTVIRDHNTPGSNKSSADVHSNNAPLTKESIVRRDKPALTTLRPRSSDSESNDEAYSPPPVISYEVFGEKRRASLASQSRHRNEGQDNRSEQVQHLNQASQIPLQPPPDLSTMLPSLQNNAIRLSPVQSLPPPVVSQNEPIIVQTLQALNEPLSSSVAVPVLRMERNMQTPFVAPQPIRLAESVPLERAVAEQERDGSSNFRDDGYVQTKLPEPEMPREDRRAAPSEHIYASLPSLLPGTRGQDRHVSSPVVTIHRSSPPPDLLSHRNYEYLPRSRDLPLHNPEDSHHSDYVVEYVPVLVPRRDVLPRRQHVQARERPVYVDEYGRPIVTRPYIEEYERQPRRVVYETERDPVLRKRIYVDERGRQVVQHVYADHARARPVPSSVDQDRSSPLRSSQQDPELSLRYRRRSSRSVSPRRTVPTYIMPIDEYYSRREGLYNERVPMVRYETRLAYPEEYSPRRAPSRAQMPPPTSMVYRESGTITEMRTAEGREVRMMTPAPIVPQRQYVSDPMVIDDERRYRERDYRPPVEYQEQLIRGRPDHRYVRGSDFITREEVERHEALRAQGSMSAQPRGS